MEDRLFSRKAIENVLIDFINITVATGENGMTGEVLTIREGMLINARIDVVDEGWQGIFRQSEGGRKLNSPISSSKVTMTNIQLPLSKGTLFIQTNIQVHVLGEMQNLHRRP